MVVQSAKPSMEESAEGSMMDREMQDAVVVHTVHSGREVVVMMEAAMTWGWRV